MAWINIGSATRGANSTVSDINVHRQRFTPNQFGDIGCGKEIVITMMNSRHVQAHRIKCLNA
jgi:hypothetical protein